MTDYNHGNISRRGFLSVLTFAWTAFIASIALGTLNAFRFFFPNVSFEKPMILKIGHIDDFTVGSVSEAWKEKYGIWIVRTEKEIFGLSTICTHLGCTPNWFQADSTFKCPCHGSVYNIAGENILGPAPRPLERFKIVMENGEIVIDKNRVFRKEKGEWNYKGAKISL